MKYTKEQAQEVLKDWFYYKEQRPTTKNTYEKFIEDKFPSLQVGKWYKDGVNGVELLIFITEIRCDEIMAYGFGNSGYWCDNSNWYYNNMYKAHQELTEATEEEVEAALIKEAERRGFRYGVEYNDINDGYRYLCKEEFELNPTFTKLMCTVGGGWIFKEGKWATPIVQDPTKEKLCELEDTIKKAQQEIQELKRLQK
jgi:hypothetical protein